MRETLGMSVEGSETRNAVLVAAYRLTRLLQ